MSNDHELILFDQYIEGSLAADEVTEFKERAANDAEFAQRFLAYRQSVKAIRQQAFAADVRQVMKAEQGMANIRFKRNLPFAIAASLAFIVLVALVVLYGPAEPPPTFAQLYRPYPNVFQQRAAQQSPMAQALAAYGAGQYPQALAQLQALPQPSDTAQFYQGMAYMATNKVPQGIKALAGIDAANTIFDQQINWYLGIAYYQQGNTAQCRQYLEAIAPGQYQYKAARQLLKAID